MSEALITETWIGYGNTSGLVEFHQGDTDGIRDLFMGHAVEKVADDHLRLDDGTMLRVIPNEGGCSCGAGDIACNVCDCGGQE